MANSGGPTSFLDVNEVPSSTPATGGLLYSNDGSLEWFSSNGSRTVLAGGSAAGVDGIFVFNPSTTGEIANEFAEWADLSAAVADLEYAIIYTSGGTIPANPGGTGPGGIAWPMSANWELIIAPGATLTCEGTFTDAPTTIRGTSESALVGNCESVIFPCNQSVLLDGVALSTEQNEVLYFHNAGFSLTLTNGASLNGGYLLATDNNAGLVIYAYQNSVIEDDSIQIDGYSVSAYYDAGSSISSTQSVNIGSFTATPLAEAYTPADPSKWSGNPTTLKEAIDRIAAVVGATIPIP